MGVVDNDGQKPPLLAFKYRYYPTVELLVDAGGAVNPAKFNAVYPEILAAAKRRCHTRSHSGMPTKAKGRAVKPMLDFPALSANMSAILP